MKDSRSTTQNHLKFCESFIKSVKSVASRSELSFLMECAAAELGFQNYALIHHDDLRIAFADRIDIKSYPPAITERLIGQGHYRRDPIIRGCLFADSAFLWSELPRLISMDRKDRASLALGAQEGLNEGITVPCFRLGERMGSCTLAGIRHPEAAASCVGAAQMIGIFAFQAARRLLSTPVAPAPLPKLHPRPRDCIVLAGRGCTNKEIARLLGLTPRTVDGYLTEARQLFGAHDRTELVMSAVLAGEVGLHELRRRQPE